MATAVSVTEVPVEALPQLAETRKSVAQAVGSHESALEPKMNGWRCLWKVSASGEARSFSRNGNELTGKMPAIESALAEALPPGSILDGEVVAFHMEDGRLVHDWGRVQEILGSGTAKAALASGALTFIAFDLIAHGGIDARALPYSERRQALEHVFAGADFPPSCVQIIPQRTATDDEYRALLEAGYEGCVVKWLDSPYASKQRGRGWWKVKAVNTVEVVVMGFKPGTPGSSFDGYVGAVEFGQYDENGLLVHRGRTSGMDWALRLDMTKNPDDYLGAVMEIAYQEVTKPSVEHPHGAFLFPRFVRMRTDKAAAEVTLHVA